MMNSDKYYSNLNTLTLNTCMTSHPRILPSTEAMLTDLYAAASSFPSMKRGTAGACLLSLHISF